MFEQVRVPSDSVQQRVVSVLKNAIIKGKLKPGDKLPGERELAGMLAVSRGSLREALKQLDAAGLVDIRHGIGVFIRENDPDTVISRFAGQLVVDEMKLRELFAVRKLLETQSAAWAAARAAAETVQRIKKLVYTTRERIAGGQPGYLALLAEQDREFHMLVAEAAGNSVMIKIMHDLLDLLAESRARSLATSGRPLKSLEEHTAVVEAIAAGDARAAEKTMRVHLTNVEREILNENDDNQTQAEYSQPEL